MINARALSIITAMADVPRDRLMAAHMIIRLDLDKYVYAQLYGPADPYFHKLLVRMST